MPVSVDLIRAVSGPLSEHRKLWGLCFKIYRVRPKIGVVFKPQNVQLGVRRLPKLCPRRGLNLKPRSRQFIIGE
jgi:hypothetical protein